MEILKKIFIFLFIFKQVCSQANSTQASSGQCCLKFSSINCIQCPMNYHLYRHVCIPNVENCQSYENGFDCLKCNEGFQFAQDIEKNVVCIKLKQYVQQIVNPQKIFDNVALLETDDFLRTRYQSIRQSKIIRAQFRTFSNKTIDIVLIYEDLANLEKVYQGVVAQTNNKDIYNFIGFFSKTKHQVDLTTPYVKPNLRTQCLVTSNISIVDNNNSNGQNQNQNNTTNSNTNNTTNNNQNTIQNSTQTNNQNNTQNATQNTNQNSTSTNTSQVANNTQTQQNSTTSGATANTSQNNTSNTTKNTNQNNTTNGTVSNQNNTENTTNTTTNATNNNSSNSNSTTNTTTQNTSQSNTTNSTNNTSQNNTKNTTAQNPGQNSTENSTIINKNITGQVNKLPTKQDRAKSFSSLASDFTLVSPQFYDKTQQIVLQYKFLRKINTQLQTADLVAVFKKQIGIYAQFKIYFQSKDTVNNKIVRYQGVTAYHLFTKAINVISFGPVIF